MQPYSINAIFSTEWEKYGEVGDLNCLVSSNAHRKGLWVNLSASYLSRQLASANLSSL